MNLLFNHLFLVSLQPLVSRVLLTSRCERLITRLNDTFYLISINFLLVPERLIQHTLCLIFLLVTQISSYKSPTTQTVIMTIPTVNYRETIFEHTNLTKIIGFLTYDTLHLLHSKIKSNAISVHSNIGSGQHGYLSLVLRPTAYALLKTILVRPVHPGTLVIAAVATRHA